MIKKCLHCDNEFKTANWDADRKFCSKKCRDEYTNIHNRVTKKCKICDNEFSCSKAEGKWRVCCSSECSEKLKEIIESKVKKICVVCNT